MARVRIGTLERERITLDVRGRGHPEADDYWDGNWLRTEIHVEVGSWRGRILDELRVDEFERFLPEVRRLHTELEAIAEFAAMDGRLFLRLVGDGSGHIKVEGEATDNPGYGNELSFRFELDQTFLPQLIRDLEDLLSEYPVVGERPSPSEGTNGSWSES